MKSRVAFVFMIAALGAACTALPLFGDENLKPPAQTVKTEHFDFAPGGMIRVSESNGDLYIEAWDEPRVEMTVTKFLAYGLESESAERATERLEGLKVTAEKKSASELIISTKPKSVRLELELRVPRNSQLDIHHHVGNVSISGVIGDIRAACGRGDIFLWLPSEGAYEVDARNRFGKVSSDFPGASRSSFLIGQSFRSPGSTPVRKLYLRMGFGGITLKPILPESQGRVATK